MKKFLEKVSEWLRRRVTALSSEKGRVKSEEGKGASQGLDVNDGDNRSLKCEVLQETSSEVYDYLCHQSPSAMGGIERSSFGYFLTEFGAQQVRVRNKRVYGVCLANANDNVDVNVN